MSDSSRRRVSVGGVPLVSVKGLKTVSEPAKAGMFSESARAAQRNDTYDAKRVAGEFEKMKRAQERLMHVDGQGMKFPEFPRPRLDKLQTGLKKNTLTAEDALIKLGEYLLAARSFQLTEARKIDYTKKDQRSQILDYLAMLGDRFMEMVEHKPPTPIYKIASSLKSYLDDEKKQAEADGPSHKRELKIQKSIVSSATEAADEASYRGMEQRQNAYQRLEAAQAELEDLKGMSKTCEAKIAAFTTDTMKDVHTLLRGLTEAFPTPSDSQTARPPSPTKR